MIKYHTELIQGSDEWFAARCGLLTAGSMKLILTPSLKQASNDKERSHVYEMAAQRITQFVEPSYINDDMLRGQEDEVSARIFYAERYAPVEDMGLITNNKWGFTLAYSPDGMVGDDGLIEVKSRRQKFQVETLVRAVPGQSVPDDYILQIQTGLLVSERDWCDFISYSGGMPMCVIRVFPDQKMQDAILEAAGAFEARVQAVIRKYQDTLNSDARLVPTERRVEQEIML